MRKKRLGKQKKLRLVLALSIVILAGFFTLLLPQIYDGNDSGRVEAAPVECVRNSDCIIVRGSFCACDDGGAPKCIAKNRLGDYTKSLESCTRNDRFFDEDCGQITCGCVDNVCIGRPA